ncbi:MAG: hypothetical protein E7462_03065 [Ruminococcaceae bacterium]|nr:hypothetical protein [Oscillospiraceae bacterium]
MANQPQVRYINAYVSGNVAYQPEKKPQRKQSAQLPKARRPKVLKIYVDVVALGGILAAAVLSVMLVVGLVQLSQAKAEEQMLTSHAATLQAENQQLLDTYTSSYDLEEIREIATAMGMVPIEEVPHLQVPVTVPQTEQAPTAWESFWAFMVGLFA